MNRQSDTSRNEGAKPPKRQAEKSPRNRPAARKTSPRRLRGKFPIRFAFPQFVEQRDERSVAASAAAASKVHVKSESLYLRENCVEELLDEGSRTYPGRISLACLAECPHHAGSAVEAGAADERTKLNHYKINLMKPPRIEWRGRTVSVSRCLLTVGIGRAGYCSRCKCDRRMVSSGSGKPFVSVPPPYRVVAIPRFLATENTIRQSDLCAARQTETAKTKSVYVHWIVAWCIIFRLRSKRVQNACGEADKKLVQNLINLSFQFSYNRVLRDTYEKGAAFAEGQGPDCSSGVRGSRCREEDEVDTAPKPRAHNRRCRDEGCGIRAKGYLGEQTNAFTSSSRRRRCEELREECRVLRQEVLELCATDGPIAARAIEKRLMSGPEKKNAREEARTLPLYSQTMKSVRETLCSKTHQRGILREGSCCVLRCITRFLDYGSLIAALSMDEMSLSLRYFRNLQMTEEPLTTLWQPARPVLPPTLVFMTRDALLLCLDASAYPLCKS
ncbi:hypothetical protein DBV15_01452 [Temnothorax longispinosus]|uniref:Uncharacterized protein n=1 Tax=Temnothorax longispinosus TaxID=300112 RepID=A0A4S2KU38_9HYME|nr:hypothetical protein DBV15_01452 [Temnothorax longispinosus]